MSKVEAFKKKASIIHKGRYTYDKVIFKNSKEKVSIDCLIHGSFEQTPNKHLLGRGCPECGNINKGKSRTEGILKRKYGGLQQPKDYKLVPLVNGKVSKVDNEDFEELKRINWTYSRGYAVTSKHGFLHRYLLKPPKDMFVDHINRDPLDNRRSNLRIVTPQENAFNTGSTLGSTSKLKGVSWDSSKGKWLAQIGFKRKNIFLGRTDCEKEAGILYDKKAKELYGEYAKLNF